MKEYYINVNFEDNTIETDLKELVQNDYNSIRLNFEFDIEYDTAMFELKYPNGDTWQKQIVDGSLVIPKGVLYQTEEYEYEISVYTTEGKLTHNKIKNFNVRSELVKDNIPMNDDRVPILSDLINKANKAVENVESFKEEIGMNKSSGISILIFSTINGVDPVLFSCTIILSFVVGFSLAC